jgi:hypothetical protein
MVDGSGDDVGGAGDGGTDLLYISYQRPRHVERSLPRLLDTCGDGDRVWIWQNGEHAETLGVLDRLVGHPAVHDVHISPDNQIVRGPTNWLWSRARGSYVGKVDDDALVPHGWLERLREVHEADPTVGVVGCWRFLPSDAPDDAVAPRLRRLDGGHEILQCLWVEGSGYLMKRVCVEAGGPLQPGQSFTRYCIELARRGWVNGWVHPFLLQEDLDDPRMPHTLMRSDDDVVRHNPLGAQKAGIDTLEAWAADREAAARAVLASSLDPGSYRGVRGRLRILRTRLRRLRGGQGRLRWNRDW